MANQTTNLDLIWEGLGTFWGQFPNKPLITELWTTYRDVAYELYRIKAQADISKYMQYLKPVMDYHYMSYPMVFSGDDQNTITSSGLNAYEVPKYTFSIPTMRGINTDQALVEGVDYEIYDKRFVRFLTDPDFESENIGIENAADLYAENVYRHNPVLWNIHASGIGLDVSSLDNASYLPYNIIVGSGINRTIDIAGHYKYIIWGLSETQRSAPTIANLVRGYGISRGLPFAYRAGTATSVTASGIRIAVSGLNSTYDDYIIPTDYTITAAEDEFIPQFSLLISGIGLYDQVSNRALIDSLEGVNDFNYTSTVAFTYDTNLDDLTYDESFHLSFVKSLMPVGLNYQSIAE